MQSREEPLQLKLDTYKSVFFKPTRVGCSSTSLFAFRNPTRLPLEFEWKISQQYRKTLGVQPARGLIQPNESLVSALPRVPAVLTCTIISYACLIRSGLLCAPSIRSIVTSPSLMRKCDYHDPHLSFCTKELRLREEKSIC